MNVINFTLTKVGERYLRYELLHPLTNIAKIQKRYGWIEAFQTNSLELGEQLKNIKDIEKLNRKLLIAKIHPKEMVGFIQSFEFIYTLFVTVKDIFNITKETLTMIREMCNYFGKLYNLENMSRCTIQDFHLNIYKRKVFPDIDKIVQKIEKSENILHVKQSVLSSVLSDSKQKLSVKLDQSDKLGHYFEITKKRYDII